MKMTGLEVGKEEGLTNIVGLSRGRRWDGGSLGGSLST